MHSSLKQKSILYAPRLLDLPQTISIIMMSVGGGGGGNDKSHSGCTIEPCLFTKGSQVDTGREG